MEAISVLSSISKVAIIAFIITVVLIGFEIFTLLRKKTETVKISDFKPGQTRLPDSKKTVILGSQFDTKIKTRHKFLLIFTFVGLGLFFVALFMISRLVTEQKIERKIEAVPQAKPTETLILPSPAVPDSSLEQGIGSTATPTISFVTAAPISSPIISPSVAVPTPPAGGSPTASVITSPTPTAISQTLPQTGGFSKTLLFSGLILLSILIPLIL